MIVLSETQRKLSAWLLVFLAALGLVNLAAGVIQQVMGFFASLILLSVSGFGVVWLLSLATQRRFTDKEVIFAIAIIIAGFILYHYTPQMFPETFSLMPIG